TIGTIKFSINALLILGESAAALPGFRLCFHARTLIREHGVTHEEAERRFRRFIRRDGLDRLDDAGPRRAHGCEPNRATLDDGQPAPRIRAYRRLLTRLRVSGNATAATRGGGSRALENPADEEQVNRSHATTASSP